MKHRKLKDPRTKKSPLSAAGKKMLEGDFTGGKRPKPPPKPKVRPKVRPKTLRDRRMDRIIENKTEKKSEKKSQKKGGGGKRG